MEEVILKKMHKIIGWTEKDGDGIFCPGKKKMFLKTSTKQNFISTSLNS